MVQIWVQSSGTGSPADFLVTGGSHHYIGLAEQRPNERLGYLELCDSEHEVYNRNIRLTWLWTLTSCPSGNWCWQRESGRSYCSVQSNRQVSHLALKQQISISRIRYVAWHLAASWESYFLVSTIMVAIIISLLLKNDEIDCLYCSSNNSKDQIHALHLARPTTPPNSIPFKSSRRWRRSLTCVSHLGMCILRFTRSQPQ